MFVGRHEQYDNAPSFVSSDHAVSRTRTVTQDMAETDDKGRQVVKAGTVFPANDGTAEGILLAEVDVTEGNQPGGVMVEGYVYEARLPQNVTEEAKESMKEIKFEQYNETEED